MTQAAAQARRTADLESHQRQTIERPDASRVTQAINLKEAVQPALYLLEPESRRRAVVPRLLAPSIVTVQADPMALEQITVETRAIEIAVSAQDCPGVLTVTDSGAGIFPEALAHLFEPSLSTRDGGLGLGLNLCETLTHAMGGTLTGANAAGRGVVSTLSLPLHQSSA